MLGKLISKMLKSEAEWKSGKIQHYCLSGWALGDEPYINYSGMEIAPRPDRLGRMMHLTRGDYVINCPEPPGGQDLFAKGGHGFYVPLSKCKRCPNYKRPATRGRRFPACAALVQLRSSHVVGSETANLAAQAVAKANSVLGGIL